MPSPNHVLHLLLSIVTAGLWLIVWLVIATGGHFTCGECGTRVLRDAPSSGPK